MNICEIEDEKVKYFLWLIIKEAGDISIIEKIFFVRENKFKAFFDKSGFSLIDTKGDSDYSKEIVLEESTEIPIKDLYDQINKSIATFINLSGNLKMGNNFDRFFNLSFSNYCL